MTSVWWQRGACEMMIDDRDVGMVRRIWGGGVLLGPDLTG